MWNGWLTNEVSALIGPVTIATVSHYRKPTTTPQAGFEPAQGLGSNLAPILKIHFDKIKIKQTLLISIRSCSFKDTKSDVITHQETEKLEYLYVHSGIQFCNKENHQTLKNFCKENEQYHYFSFTIYSAFIRVSWKWRPNI